MKEIVIFCPTDVISGGVNSLHNLCASLTRKGFSASMFYIGKNETFLNNQLIKSYQARRFEGTLDLPGQIIIVPETMTRYLLNFSKTTKIVYWLSLNYFFKNPDWQFPFNYKLLRKLINCPSYHGYGRGIIENTKRKLNNYAKRKVNIWTDEYVHISNSYFVADYCKSQGSNQTFVVQNPVRDEVYNVKVLNDHRKNTVLFGQKTSKLMIFLAKIVLKKIRVIRIKKMPYNKVIQLMLESKVFIELGINLGRDRMPREASLLGCIIFMNRRGSSSNKKDYKIKDEYILKNSPFLFLRNLMKIKKAVINYEKQTTDFQEFNLQLQEEKRNFDKNVQKAFNQIIELQKRKTLFIK